MTARARLLRLLQQEDLNFLLTNRLPRRLLTQFMDWFSRIEQPLVRDLSIATWRFFGDLDLSEAKKTHFRSMHDCFTRELKEGARCIDADPEILVSPCDAIVGMCGRVNGTHVYQAKGISYSLPELFCDEQLADVYRNGSYATLRLTSSMYHRFHAPYACRVEQVSYVSGDVWNVNAPALRRIDKLFCRNERAVLRTILSPGNQIVTLVPVAAVLVASIRLHCLDVPLTLAHRGTTSVACAAQFRKGEEMGWFEQGSTIIVFAPEALTLCDTVREGATVRVGQPLMRLT